MSANAPHERSDDAAAYVLGALEPEEAREFARHLESCPTCRDEVAALQRVVDVLPAAVPQYKAPAGLRRRILRAARTHARGQAQGARRQWWSWTSRPMLAGATALAVAIVAVVIALSGGGSPHARVITATVTGQGTAHVRVVGGHAELILTDFPAPPPGKVYEVWLQRGSAPPSPTRTLFTVSGHGAAKVAVTGSLSGVSQLMVTPEPPGGSAVPTHAPVIVARTA
jgi:anti-sigma-K factor RskA